MSTMQMEHRVAILLNLCGSDVADSVLGQLGPERRERLRKCLEAVDASPPTSKEIDEVVGEFRRFFRFATSGELAEFTPQLKLVSADDDAADSPARKPGKRSPKEAAGTNRAKAAEDEEADGPFEFTDDPIADLNRLRPFQVASALAEEHPRTIAVVVNCMESENASRALAELPGEVRKLVFVQLPTAPRGATPLIKRIVRTTVEKAATVRRDPLAAGREESDRRIAELLRSTPRKERNELLAALEENDPDTAERIKDYLYVFEDLLNIEDMSLQMLLREVELGVVARALQQADQEIIDKVMRNIASRARQTLVEEMEFTGSLSSDELEAARKTVVTEIAQLDQAGQLKMINE